MPTTGQAAIAVDPGGLASMADGDLQGLAGLVEAARSASRQDRITFRDPIAVFGTDAITALSPWVVDPELAAFAVRVIGRAGMLGPKSAAIEALTRARPGVSAVTRGDIDEALELLGARRSSAGVTTTPNVPIQIAENLYERLVEVARTRRTLTYSEAGELVGLSMRNPNHRKLLGQQLGAISEYEVDHGRPMLSAVVIHKGERPGTGFAQLGEDIGLKSSFDTDASFADRELFRVYAYWARPPMPQIETSTGAPDFRTYLETDLAPEALGTCEYKTGRERCLNAGLWDRDGHLCCASHALARDPVLAG
jgi:hypothetical protein